MLILKIKQPGLLLELPGISPRRTPTEIDITKCDLNNVLVELRSKGISNFEIKNKSNDRNESVQNKSKTKKDNINKTEYSEVISNNFMEKLENIENLLLELNENINVNNIQLDNPVSNNLQEKNKEEIDEDEEDFIPNIDLSGLKLNK